MACHDDLLAVVYHRSIGTFLFSCIMLIHNYTLCELIVGLKGDQNLAFLLYAIGADRQKHTTPLDLPLSPKSTLVWLG